MLIIYVTKNIQPKKESRDDQMQSWFYTWSYAEEEVKG